MAEIPYLLNSQTSRFNMERINIFVLTRLKHFTRRIKIFLGKVKQSNLGGSGELTDFERVIFKEQKLTNTGI